MGRWTQSRGFLLMEHFHGVIAFFMFFGVCALLAHVTGKK
jgi:hypothetical protein